MIKKLISLNLGIIIVLVLISPLAFAEESTKVIAWEDLEKKLREENLSSKAFEESINSIETINYTNMYYNLKNQLNQLSAAQDFLVLTGQSEKVLTIAQTATSLRTTYEDIENGKLQRDSENAINQLRDAQNQVVLAGQSLYINILSLERSLHDGERGLEALERSLTEMRLRKEFGQVSDKTVADIEKKHSDVISNLKSLRNSIFSCKAQLQLLIGYDPDGMIELGALPEIIGTESSNFDFEKDLISAKEKSSILKNAKIVLEKSEENYRDSEKSFVSGNLLGYQRDSARYTYEAEKLNYESTVRSFELSFKEIYLSVLNYEQILENKIENVKYNEKQVKIAEKNYELGRISYFALLAAKDSLETAKSEMSAAQSDVFAALNRYNAAIEYGIVS